MFTRITPARAVAYCVSTHSAQLGLQMPTRSPRSRPRAIRPRATRSTAPSNSAYDMRTPWWRDTIASASGTRATVRARLAPIVSPRRGVVDTPCEYESNPLSTLSRSCEVALRTNNGPGSVGSPVLSGRLRANVRAQEDMACGPPGLPRPTRRGELADGKQWRVHLR